MKSQIKIYREDLADFYNWLVSQSVETNTENVEWRVMMFRRKGQSQWSQVYDGLTRNAKQQRAFFRVFGCDADLVNQFYKLKRNQK